METYPLPSATVYLALFTGLTNPSQIRARLVAASTMPDDNEGNKERDRLDFAFVEAAMITSRLHILTAIQQSLISQSSPTGMKTKTIHSEILWQLEPGTNASHAFADAAPREKLTWCFALLGQINDSLKHFGLSPSTQSLLLIHVAPLSSEEGRTFKDAKEREDTIFGKMIDVVGDDEGGKSGVTLESLEKLGRLEEKEGGVNWKSLRKIYKLNQDAVLKGLELGSDQERQILDQLCISQVALKTVAA